MRFVPILMFHRVADIPGDRNAMPPKMFEARMEYLASHNFHTIGFDDLLGGAPLPERPVLLTFDDGCRDVFTEAMPCMLRHGMTATVFMVSGAVGKTNAWETDKAPSPMMSAEELQNWHRHGFTVGAHTVDHKPLNPLLSDAEIERELTESRRALEEILNAPVDFFAYPYGIFDARAKRLTAKHFRAAAAITDNVPLAHFDRYAILRIAVSSKESLNEFKLKVSSFAPLLVAGKRIEADVRMLRKRIFGR
ncbi:MAG: polysaccharide deacetylase family protein [Victivallaceae bacterium]|nr:polysaccharide deacetylase family protein [Victivallaceae bacterium]